MGMFVLLLMCGGWLVGFFNSTLHIQDKWNGFSLLYTDLFARKCLWHYGLSIADGYASFIPHPSIFLR